MSKVKAKTAMKMVPKNVVKQDVKMAEIKKMAERVKNWGKWGPDDELGTLNYVKPADLLQAAALVKNGKSFSLGLDFNQNGPQRTGWGGRFNPIHTMLATGTDAVAGRHDKAGLRYADDMVTMPLQCGTQWDGLGPHLLRRKNVERLRRAARRLHRRQEKRHPQDARQHDRPRRAARHSALPGRRLSRRRLRHRQRGTRCVRESAGRGGASAAIS